MSFAVVRMLCTAVTLHLEEPVLTVFVYVCVMLLKRAVSDSIRVQAAQSGDYLSQGRVSTAVLPAPCYNRNRLNLNPKSLCIVKGDPSI